MKKIFFLLILLLFHSYAFSETFDLRDPRTYDIKKNPHNYSFISVYTYSYVKDLKISFKEFFFNKQNGIKLSESLYVIQKGLYSATISFYNNYTKRKDKFTIKIMIDPQKVYKLRIDTVYSDKKYSVESKPMSEKYQNILLGIQQEHSFRDANDFSKFRGIFSFNFFSLGYNFPVINTSSYDLKIHENIRYDLVTFLFPISFVSIGTTIFKYELGDMVLFPLRIKIALFIIPRKSTLQTHDKTGLPEGFTSTMSGVFFVYETDIVPELIHSAIEGRELFPYHDFKILLTYGGFTYSNIGAITSLVIGYKLKTYSIGDNNQRLDHLLYLGIETGLGISMYMLPK